MIELADPASDLRWRELIARRRAGLFHSPPWLRAVARTYDFRIEAVLLPADPQPAGLACCRLDDILGGRIVSAPFSDACDPLVESADQWAELSAWLRAPGLPVTLRCLDDGFALGDPAFRIARRARWHRLDLAPDEASLWRGLDGSTRRSVRKAERSGVVVRPLPGVEGARAFHRLHLGLRKAKYRMLAQPVTFFEHIAEEFGETGWRALGAWQDDRLVAAAIFLHWDGVLYYKFGASRLDALDARPNSLLMWEGIRTARALDCRMLDLGPSDDDQPGLIRFKRHLGAAEHELTYLRHEPPGWRDESAAWRTRLHALTELLTRPEVPDEVTSEAGGLLYRFFA